MSASTQQLRKICTTHTNPGLDNPFRLMLPNCHSGFSLPSQPIPHKHTLQLHWPLKTQGGPLQNQVAAFQRYKIEFKKKLSLPHGNHLLSSIITRPHTTRFSGAGICHQISYFQKAMLFIFCCPNQNCDFLDYHRLLLLSDMRPCPYS